MTAEHAAAAGGEVELVEAVTERIVEAIECQPRHKVMPFVRMEIEDDRATTRQAAADTVLAAARRLCCGDNPAPHHAATDAHSQRMAFAEELARAVRGS